MPNSLESKHHNFREITNESCCTCKHITMCEEKIEYRSIDGDSKAMHIFYCEKTKNKMDWSRSTRMTCDLYVRQQ